MSELRYKGRTIVLIKPTTYMNLSGKAVKYWMQQEKIPIENVLVVLDEIALPLGTLRMRKKGSDAGHNGLADIIESLGTNVFEIVEEGMAAHSSSLAWRIPWIEEPGGLQSKGSQRAEHDQVT